MDDATRLLFIRSALKGARGLAFDEEDRALDEELAAAIDHLDALTPADAPSDLRAAAFWIATATDVLERWDVEHRYVINSERDTLAGNVSEAWAALRAALSGDRPSPEADPLMVECAICGDYSVKGVEVHEACLEMLSRGGASPATAPAEGLTVTKDRCGPDEAPHWHVFARRGDEFVSGGETMTEAEADAEYARLAPDSAQVAKLSSSAQPPDSALLYEITRRGLSVKVAGDMIGRVHTEAYAAGVAAARAAVADTPIPTSPYGSATAVVVGLAAALAAIDAIGAGEETS